MGWIDWLRYVLTPLLVAVLAATIATRNARKTPHERLKNLVDIHDKMPDGLDQDNVVESAIIRELVDFDRRVAADQRGFWAGLKERIAQLPAATIVGAATVCVLAALVAIGFVLFPQSDDKSSADLTSAITTAVAVSVGLAVVGFVGALYLTRPARTEGRIQQLAASILALYLQPGKKLSGGNRRIARTLAAGGTVRRTAESEAFITALKRYGLVDVIDYEAWSTEYEATPWGRQVLKRYLSHHNYDDTSLGD